MRLRGATRGPTHGATVSAPSPGSSPLAPSPTGRNFKLGASLSSKRGSTAKRELEMAERLVESLSTTFDPSRYHDEHREKVLALIEKKAAGEEIVAPPSEAPAKVVNLADALAASLAAARRSAGPGGRAASHEPRQGARSAPRRQAARAAGKRRRKGA